ncbi:TolC family protein [Neomoorella humiferrea]|uniref:Outer membrane efflux protein n=1 Tax=Neomoorella humiferrea TaxID=676965 RepID=A0A2T0AUT3_9FIRM|nr:TolC family protein [Moorella humiferrea]PRR74247.1 Outer membrane efflux protein [Moorella humiferrea]
MRKILRKILTAFVGALLIIAFAVPTAIAASSKDGNGTGEVISLQQAVDMAIKNDETLKSALAEIDRTRALRENAQENMSFTPVEGGYNGAYGPQIEASWLSLLGADLNYRASQRTYQANLDTLALKVCKAYWDVQVAREKVALQEKVMQQALLNLQNARAAVQAGTAAASTLTAAESAWKQAEDSLTAAKHTLDSAYTTFNNLVGLDAGARPLLQEEPAYSPLDIANLEYEVQRVLENDPNVWKAQQNIDVKRWSATMMYSSGSYTPYDARQAELQQAEYTLETVKEATALKTRSLYYQIKSLEENYSAAQAALSAAQEKLRVEQAKAQVGMNTKADVIAAEVDVAKAQEALDELVRNHAYLKLAFEKPWAMS